MEFQQKKITNLYVALTDYMIFNVILNHINRATLKTVKKQKILTNTD